ncbi:hypothetical protein [Rothia sp. ZJ1223]|uniref:hypothetical protein n=1 Tax=Rothia sp. ZJ1223 TaxID=2811098 RepID=UPI00195CEECD|nr:hypothetical protein [Rothia sp. ZJ1223]MBM7051377.1 hypothetical protein [Rothia sp. ZJ1223]
MASAEHVRAGSANASAHTTASAAGTHHTNESEAEKRSNVETLGVQEGDYFNGGHPYYSGTKDLGGSIVMFVVCMAILLGSLWAFGTYPEGGWIWFTGGILLYGLTFIIPTLLLPSKTTHAKTDGVTPAMR